MFTSEKRLYLTADKSRVVEEGDPEAAFLLVGAGAQIPLEEAEKYGLTKKPARPGGAAAGDAAAEAKAVRKKEDK